MEVSLVSSVDRDKELDYSAYNEPIGVFKYDSTENDIVYDRMHHLGQAYKFKELEIKTQRSQIRREEVRGLLLQFILLAMVLLAGFLIFGYRRKVKFNRKIILKNERIDEQRELLQQKK
jgi:cell division protein FtsL